MITIKNDRLGLCYRHLGINLSDKNNIKV
jgi:hypothetical protein